MKNKGRVTEMKIHKKILLSIVISIFLLFMAGVWIINSFFNPKLDDLNGSGDHQHTFLSPNKKYSADVFQINKGGATVSYQQRVSITSLKDDKKEFDDKTIYWVYPSEDDISIEWKSGTVVVINGRTIDIKDPNTYYNWKKE